MCIWAALLFGILFPLAFFVSPCLPSSSATGRRPFDMSYVLTRSFALHQQGNIVHATGYFIPSIYLSSFARAKFAASSFRSALTVLLDNVASTVGSIIMGILTVKLQVTTCIAITTTGAAIGVCLMWGFSSSVPLLCVFCMAYGMFAGG